MALPPVFSFYLPGRIVKARHLLLSSFDPGLRDLAAQANLQKVASGMGMIF